MQDAPRAHTTLGTVYRPHASVGYPQPAHSTEVRGAGCTASHVPRPRARLTERVRPDAAESACGWDSARARAMAMPVLPSHERSSCCV